MQIEIEEIDQAILDMFVESKVQQGEWVFMESLLEQWPNTKLRAACVEYRTYT